jgi:pentatricopeptide repeat protein
MQTQGVEPSIVTYTALMTCFGRAGELGRCRALRRSMAAAGVSPDARFYRAALAALAPAGDKEGCLGLLEAIGARVQQGQEQEQEEAVDLVRPRLDGATYRHVAALCEAAGRPELLAFVGDGGARTSAV